MEKTDIEIYSYLKKVELCESVRGLPGGLLTEVAEGSNLFSMGQK
jgi:ABC-type multidrug transport system fused ATPase/permease subunit